MCETVHICIWTSLLYKRNLSQVMPMPTPRMRYCGKLVIFLAEQQLVVKDVSIGSLHFSTVDLSLLHMNLTHAMSLIQRLDFPWIASAALYLPHVKNRYNS
jgi:hypothetical protein